MCTETKRLREASQAGMIQLLQRLYTAAVAEGQTKLARARLRQISAAQADADLETLVKIWRDEMVTESPEERARAESAYGGEP
jgi:hypothetical protein